MTLDDLLSPYRNDDDERPSTMRRRRSSMVRNSLPLSRFWSPSDALSRQPWYGFPGGREAWLEWRQTGQLPAQNGETQSRQLTPEQQDFYYRINPNGPKQDGTTFTGTYDYIGGQAPGQIGTGAVQSTQPNVVIGSQGKHRPRDRW